MWWPSFFLERQAKGVSASLWAAGCEHVEFGVGAFFAKLIDQLHRVHKGCVACMLATVEKCF
jgi:hypothetical protein